MVHLDCSTYFHCSRTVPRETVGAGPTVMVQGTSWPTGQHDPHIIRSLRATRGLSISQGNTAHIIRSLRATRGLSISWDNTTRTSFIPTRSQMGRLGKPPMPEFRHEAPGNLLARKELLGRWIQATCHASIGEKNTKPKPRGKITEHLRGLQPMSTKNGSVRLLSRSHFNRGKQLQRIIDMAISTTNKKSCAHVLHNTHPMHLASNLGSAAASRPHHAALLCPGRLFTQLCGVEGRKRLVVS
jgi:hypothetical protein